MSMLVKGVKLIYPGHRLNGKPVDVRIKGKTIAEAASELKAKSKEDVIDAKGMLLFPSLVDLQCSIGEPGFEYKESLESAAKAARAGGFGTIVMLPNTEPVIDHKTQLDFIEKEAKQLPAQILAYGSITKNADGSELSEMYDLHAHGAVGFSDGKHPIDDVNMMKRALEYVKGFNGMISSFPLDSRLNPGGMVNESAANTSLGLKQMPALAEELMLNRDLYLLEYTESRLHVATISTAGSVQLVREAKKKKLSLTCGVALANLLFNESSLQAFDSNYKVNPPLRSEKDRKSLIEALKKGDLDVIVSDHTPENIENKDREFDQASYGMTMLETALSLINMHLKELSWDQVIDAMSLRPRAILGMPIPDLESARVSDFTLFDPKEKWTYDAKTCLSKSHNSPVFGKELTGRVKPLG